MRETLGGETSNFGNLLTGSSAQSLNSDIIIARASVHMRQLTILIVLSKVTAQYLQITMSHQSLQNKDIHTTLGHVEIK